MRLLSRDIISKNGKKRKQKSIKNKEATKKRFFMVCFEMKSVFGYACSATG